jgi:hypothetical protein
MITGYNTDVRHGDVVFHVQTEDKGKANPCIESLVYVGGQVLATRRSSYSDLLEAGVSNRAVLERMEKQHRAMIAAIRRGKLDGRMTQLLGGRAPAAGGEDTDVAPEAAGGAAAAPSPGAAFDDGDRTLDQVILDYLSSEAEQEQLVLLIEGEPRLGAGAPVTVRLRAASSKSGAPVPGAEVVVRLISTVAEPRVLTSGATDGDGSVALSFEIPDLGRGTSALIINANSTLGRAELKQLL